MTTEIADAWSKLIICCGIGFLIVSGAVCIIISTVSNYGDDIVKLIKETRSDKSEDAAYERGYRDGKNSASITPSTTPTITPFEYKNWWENPLCKSISGGDSSISVKLGVNNEV